MEPVKVATPGIAEAKELAAVAALTFPLACPPTAPLESITAFIHSALSAERFVEYINDPDRAVLAAYEDGRIIGYCMLIRGVPDDTDVQRAVTDRPAAELSKMYVLPDNHSSGIAAALMRAALERAIDMGARCMWLGVNQENQRAQRFYAKHGFAINGTKVFHLAISFENDYVMVRPL